MAQLDARIKKVMSNAADHAAKEDGRAKDGEAQMPKWFQEINKDIFIEAISVEYCVEKFHRGEHFTPFES